MKIDLPSHLSDDDLTARVKSLARGEQEATALVIAHLAEFDRRRLYLGLGFSSLFTYCCEVLRLSEPAAYNRIEVARVARSFPAILPMLGEGWLSVATVRLLAPHLTAENQQELLAQARGKSKRAVEEMLVRYFPTPDIPSSVRKLPVATALAESAEAPAMSIVPSTLPGPVLAVPSRPAPIRPLAPDRFEFRFTGNGETREKLRLAQDLLRHANPGGDVSKIINRALRLLIEELGRKKFATTDRPRASRGTVPGSRDISAKVRRPVGLRDDGRCTFVGKGGRRCNERAFIEFHHIEPHGVGGAATVANIKLLCRAHNRFESERFYGRAYSVGKRTLPGKSWRTDQPRPDEGVPAGG